MGKEHITQKQAIVVMIIFTLGSTLVLGAGGAAKNDIWLAILIAMLMAVPMLLIYSRILTIYPDKSLFEVMELVFGKVFGKILTLPFIWFALHLGCLVIRNFTEFIVIVSLPSTPQNIIAIFMTVLCIWAVRAGIEVIGRWTAIMLPILIAVILAVTFLFAPILDFGNLKPVLYEGIKPVLDSAFSVFAFPFTETVLFLTLLNKLRPKSNPYKVYFWNLLIGGSIILMVSVRTLLSLGVANISILYFPSYASVRLINIGDFLERIEVSVAMIFLFAGFIKISVCLYAASTGLASFLNYENYRRIVAPVGLLMMILSIIIYSNTSEMFEWANNIYKYYALPFEVFLPIIILILAEVKTRLARNKKKKIA
jgi:spore germination protein KB